MIHLILSLYSTICVHKSTLYIIIHNSYEIYACIELNNRYLIRSPSVRVYIYIHNSIHVQDYLISSGVPQKGGAGEVAQAVGRLGSQGPHAETHPGDGLHKRTCVYIYMY